VGPRAARRSAAVVLALLAAACGGKSAGSGPAWTEWGQDAQHAGTLAVNGQALSTVYFDYAYDPFVFPELSASSGQLSVHYMTPLTDGDSVTMETKSGSYSSDTYSAQTWGVVQFRWVNGALVRQWQATSDWKAVGGTGDFWEPVFHGAIANGHLYIPGGRGTILKLDGSGAVAARIVPAAWDANTYTVSPITVDGAGHLYFTVLRLQAPGPAVPLSADEIVGSNDGWTPTTPSTFYGTDALDSFLVQVDPDDSSRFVSVSSLVPDAPKASDACETTFADADLPWPPGAAAVAPTSDCGTQRVALNAAPAVASDGTIYVVTRAQFNSRYAYLVAVNTDLTPRWESSLRDRFHDGCGVPHAMGGQLEANGAPEGCAVGATYGVDPATNRPGAGRVMDDASSSPVVAPDGSVFYGAYTLYNYSQGHLMHFDAAGAYLGAYPFGWDTTPAIYVHGGTYSVVTKENHYGSMGSYCSVAPYCPPDRVTYAPDYPEAYFVTQLSPELDVEWQFKATNQKSCASDGVGHLTCDTDHPFSFEWCVNAPAIDATGTAYVNSEDGWLYAITQGGKVRDRIFQQAAIGAAYTPTSLDSAGRVYSQNSGHLFVVGR